VLDGQGWVGHREKAAVGQPRACGGARARLVGTACVLSHHPTKSAVVGARRWVAAGRLEIYLALRVDVYPGVNVNKLRLIFSHPNSSVRKNITKT